MDRWMSVLAGGLVVAVVGIAGLGFGLKALVLGGALMIVLGLAGIAFQGDAAVRIEHRPTRSAGPAGHTYFFGA